MPPVPNSLVTHVLKPRLATAIAGARLQLSRGVDRTLHVARPITRQAMDIGHQGLARAPETLAFVGKWTTRIGTGVAVYDYGRNQHAKLKGKPVKEIDWDDLLADTTVLGLTIVSTCSPAKLGSTGRALVGVGASAGGTVKELALEGKNPTQLLAPDGRAGTEAAMTGMASAVLGETRRFQLLGGMAGLYSTVRGVETSRCEADAAAMALRWAAQSRLTEEDVERLLLLAD